jgi:hypothetical protein
MKQSNSDKNSAYLNDTHAGVSERLQPRTGLVNVSLKAQLI